MDPIRKLQHACPKWPAANPPRSLLPVDSVQLSDAMRKNAEHLGDLSRLRQNEARFQQQSESWLDYYRRESEHQQTLLAILREAQDAWLEAFRASYKTNQEAFDKACRMWSDYFTG